MLYVQMFQQENRHSEQESFTSSDKVMASKKRAAFGDITNVSKNSWIICLLLYEFSLNLYGNIDIAN